MTAALTVPAPVGQKAAAPSGAAGANGKADNSDTSGGDSFATVLHETSETKPAATESGGDASPAQTSATAPVSEAETQAVPGQVPPAESPASEFASAAAAGSVAAAGAAALHRAGAAVAGAQHDATGAPGAATPAGVAAGLAAAAAAANALKTAPQGPSAQARPPEAGAAQARPGAAHTPTAVLPAHTPMGAVPVADLPDILPEAAAASLREAREGSALKPHGVAAGLTQAATNPAAAAGAAVPQTTAPGAQNTPLLAAVLRLQELLSGQDSGPGDSAGERGGSDAKAAMRPTMPALPLDARGGDVPPGQSFQGALAAGDVGTQTSPAKETAATAQPRRAQVPTIPSAQIAVHIVRAVADGISRFNVQLQPSDLGKVEVRMEVGSDGYVKARVVAERPETLDHLQRDSRMLERALQDAGLKADAQSLSFGLRSGQNGRDLPENRGRSAGNADGAPALLEEVDVPMIARWSMVAGSSGALDIRV